MAVSYKDYYKILEVGRNATTEEIDKSYKKLARKYHPDLNPGDSAAEEKFKEVNEAHEVLKDPQKRKLYDQLGPNWKDGQNFQGAPGFENFQFNFQGGQGGFGGGDFSDFFEMLFGQHGGFGGSGFGGGFGGAQYQRQRRGQDVEATVQVTLEEAHKGGPKSFTLNMPEGPKSLKVNIPAGVKNGAKLRLAGQGRAGMPNGDLYLTVHYALHPKFTSEGFDISCQIYIKPTEAVFGTKLRVPTLEGEVEIKIPAGIKSGKKLRLKGKGIGAKGDEYVVIDIDTPNLAAMSEKEKTLWEELADITAQNERERK